MRLWWKAVGIFAVLALLVAGCGDDDDDESASRTTSGDSTTARSAQESPTPTGAADLDRFLIRADEAPGLSPSGEPTALLSLRALVEESTHPRLRSDASEFTGSSQP